MSRFRYVIWFWNGTDAIIFCYSKYHSTAMQAQAECRRIHGGGIAEYGILAR